MALLLTPPSYVFLVLLLLLTLTIKATDVHCNQPYYGKPHFDHCYHLLSALPSIQDANTRLFIEQQLREGPRGLWPGVENQYPDAMVQVPKYWSYGAPYLYLYSRFLSSI